MMLTLELKKLKRTGVFWAFLAGGAFASCFSVANLLYRPEIYNAVGMSVAKAITDANGQLMAMLDLFAVIAGSCMLYHCEFADNAIQRLRTTPVSELSVFIGKTAALVLLSALMLLVEFASMALCGLIGLSAGEGFVSELLGYFALSLVMLLPSAVLMLLFSSIFRNMWLPLGAGVVCVLIATMLPIGDAALFPFALPFLPVSGVRTLHIATALGETILAGFGEMLFINIRRRSA